MRERKREREREREKDTRVRERTGCEVKITSHIAVRVKRNLP